MSWAEDDEGGFETRFFPAIAYPLKLLGLPWRVLLANWGFWLMMDFPELLDESITGYDIILTLIVAAPLTHVWLITHASRNPYVFEMWASQWKTGSGMLGRFNPGARTRNGVSWRGNRYLPI